MAWISKILFFVLFLVLANFLRSLLARVLGSLLGPSRSGTAAASPASQTVSGKMVKDPSCGLYVAESLAVAARVDGKTLHFCSDRCRDEYVREGHPRDGTDRPLA